MKYVLVDIGCIECGEPSSVLGIFDSKEVAEEIMIKCKKVYHDRLWTGRHDFEIFEVNKENELIDKYYIESLESKGEE